jgi:hypothetical protein
MVVMRRGARFLRMCVLIAAAGVAAAAAAPVQAHGRGGWGWGWGWSSGWYGWPGYYGAGWYGYPYAYGYGYPSVVVIQQPAPAAASAMRPSGVPWRYCPDSGLFYPHATACASGWQTVPMTEAPAAAP